MSTVKRWRIGGLAKAADTTPRTIRYYEELGLLSDDEAREPGSHRTYDEEDLQRLQEVLRLKNLLGLSLAELQAVVEATAGRRELRREWDEGVEDPVRRRELLEEARRHVEAQLDLVHRRRDEITELEAELEVRLKRIDARLRRAKKAREKTA